MRPVRLILGLVAAGAAAAALVWALRPQPVTVDLVAVATGPMEVTVSAEGTTRVRDPWAVTAPITGTLARLPVAVGDPVVRGETLVALIEPAAPALLDARARAQAEAAVTEAHAAVRLAEVVLTQAEADLAYAQAQYDRNLALVERGTISQRAFEDSEQGLRGATAAANQARFDLDLHRATLARMQAQLTLPEDPEGNGGAVRLLAPQTGTVLGVVDESARLVQAGAPILTIGNLADLQIEVDVLSADAVRLQPGAPAHVERWGGDGILEARVARVDPAGFTRVSALGIEEQRVHVTLDIETPAEARAGLGDRYRVFVRLVVWSDPAVLQVPQGALFRQGDGWAVFRAKDGRAVLTPVGIGRMQADAAQVLSGLTDGDQVILWPGARVSDGARIEPRPPG